VKIFLLIAISLIGLDTYSQFSPPFTLQGSTRLPYCANPVDVDGDGDLDIITAGYHDGKIGWFENLGNNIYSTQLLIDREINFARWADGADLDSDGDIDIIATSSFGNLIVWYENDGTNHFSSKKIISDSIILPLELILLDVNNNGHLDILYTSSYNSFGTAIGVIFNLGSGTFSDAQTVHNGNASLVKGMRLADINNDGVEDLLLTCGQNIFPGIEQVLWSENLGDGTFGIPQPIAGDVWYFNVIGAAESGDIDGDGLIDVFYYHTDQKFSWNKNLGAGIFGPEQIISTSFESIVSMIGFDSDNDGDLDLFIGDEESNKLYQFENLGGGVLALPIQLSGIYPNPGFMKQADMNLDGNLDIVIADLWNDAIIVLSNDGNSAFTEKKLSFVQYNMASSKIKTCDVELDGDLDIIYSSPESGQIKWFENLSGLKFKGEVVIANISNLKGIELADTDSDGDCDILVPMHLGNEILFIENLGGGNFSLPVSIITYGTGNPIDINIVDLDSDNILDLIVALSSSDQVVWHKGLGGNVFNSGIVVTSSADLIWSVSSSDINSDGNLDILSASRNDNKIAWYENLGGGVFGTQQIISSTAAGASDVEGFDVDLDGDIDVLSATLTDDEIVWYENQGNGTFSAKNVIFENTTNANFDIVIGDIDGDSKTDIMSSALSTHETLYWAQNLGEGNFSQKMTIADSYANTYDSYDVANGFSNNFADIDNDGDLDLLTIYQKSIAYFENYYLSHSQFRGELFIDMNENGLRDSNEVGFNQFQVETNPSNNFAYTSPNGKYIVNIDSSQQGIYEVFPTPINYWSITSDSSIYHIDVDGSFVYEDSLDFGFYPDTIVDSISVQLVGGFPRCNDTVNYWIDVQNVGTTNPSGIVQLILDDSLEFYDSYPSPDSIIGQAVYWTFDTLDYFDNIIFNVHVIMPDFMSIGDTLMSSVSAEVDTVENSFQSDILHQMLVCGYDPNDKVVWSAGIDSMGYIPIVTEKLEYTVRFQNTGNDTVFNVLILDQLDTNLVWSSIDILSSSHDINFLISTTGEVTFQFNNVNLPDSSVSFLGSQGYVNYQINLKPNLPSGTSIFNKAYIYFDQNPAVITNETINTLYDCSDIITSINLSTVTCLSDPLIGACEVLFNSTQNIIQWDLLGIYNTTSNSFNWMSDSSGILDLNVSISTDFCNLDSTFIIDIPDFLSSETDTIYACEGFGYPIFGNLETTTGYYTDTLTSMGTGCDSLDVKFLYIVEPIVMPTDTILACSGDSVFFNGSYIITPGFHSVTLPSSLVMFCDSTVSIFIESLPLPLVSITPLSIDTLCKNHSIVNFSASPIGGTFTGDGLNGNSFNPENSDIGTYTISYTYIDSDNCENSDSLNIVVDDCLGLSPMVVEDIRFFPNPVSDALTIDFGSNQSTNLKIEVYDMLGRKLLTQHSNGEKLVKINTKNLAIGQYQLIIFDNYSIQLVYQNEFIINR